MRRTAMQSLILFTICCLANFAGAQNIYAQPFSDSTNKRKIEGFKNSVKLHFGVFYIKDRHSPQKRMELIGISYERKVHEKLSLNAAYSQWESWLGGGPSGYKLEVREPLTPLDTADGTLELRSGYRIADLTIFYLQSFHKGIHIISAGLGLSYYWGWNFYMKNKEYSTIPYWNDYYELIGARTGYLGVIPQISYDCNLLKRRLNFGVDLRGRYYSGIEVAQYDLSFHVGVKF